MPIPLHFKVALSSPTLLRWSLGNGLLSNKRQHNALLFAAGAHSSSPSILKSVIRHLSRAHPDSSLEEFTILPVIQGAASTDNLDVLMSHLPVFLHPHEAIEIFVGITLRTLIMVLDIYTQALYYSVDNASINCYVRLLQMIRDEPLLRSDYNSFVRETVARACRKGCIEIINLNLSIFDNIRKFPNQSRRDDEFISVCSKFAGSCGNLEVLVLLLPHLSLPHALSGALESRQLQSARWLIPRTPPHEIGARHIVDALHCRDKAILDMVFGHYVHRIDWEDFLTYASHHGLPPQSIADWALSVGCPPQFLHQ